MKHEKINLLWQNFSNYIIFTWTFVMKQTPYSVTESTTSHFTISHSLVQEIFKVAFSVFCCRELLKSFMVSVDIFQHNG